LRRAPLVALCTLIAAGAARADEPLAGYSNGGFYLRDPSDWFVLYPRGRVQVDWVSFLNRGDVSSGVQANNYTDTRPKNSLFIRRARGEVLGTIAHHFDFHLSGEFATNPNFGQYGDIADAYIIVNYSPYCQLQLGQFDIPFSLENRTWDSYLDFMERSAVGRFIVGPAGKDGGGMLFGWLPKRVAYYSIGLFNGDGASLKNQDDYLMVAMRGLVAPLAPFARGRAWMERLWIGASFWWQKANNLGAVPLLLPADISQITQNDLPDARTQGGFLFFNGSYDNKDASGGTIRSHITPNGNVFKWAVEANIPFNRVGLRAELMHEGMDLAQYASANPQNALLTRTLDADAHLDALGYYVEAFAWILGDDEFLEAPGLEAFPRRRGPLHGTDARGDEPVWALMTAARYEHLAFDVTGLPPQSQPDANGNLMLVRDPAEGRITLDVFALAVNAWATRHVRLSANYVVNYLNGDSPRIRRNVFFQRAEHELMFRLGITL
jgi:phosphate-selective porin